MRLVLRTCRSLAELMVGIVLLLGVSTAALVQGHAWPQKKHPAAPASSASTARPHEPGAAVPLQWRGPWWAWQLLSWALGTVTAPSFVAITGLLLIDAHSDHPVFWWSLPAIVAAGNAVAILCVNQLHHRRPFIARRPLALRHAALAMMAGCGLFLLVGLASGLLPELVAPIAGTLHGVAPALATALWSAVLAAAFGLLSFGHAGALHARLAFHVPRAQRERWPAF